MDFADIQAKLAHAEAMLDAYADNRVIRAEISDARAMLIARELAMRTFPLRCECHLRRDPSGRHKSTTWKIAENAYHNFARYNGTMRTLDDIAKSGGFGCIEIRLLLKGLNAASIEWERNVDDGLSLNSPKLREFLRQNYEIKL